MIGDGENTCCAPSPSTPTGGTSSARTIPILRHKMDVLRAHCADVGRDYDDIRKTYTFTAISPGRSRVGSRGRGGDGSRVSAVRRDARELRDHIRETERPRIRPVPARVCGFPDTNDIGSCSSTRCCRRFGSGRSPCPLARLRHAPGAWPPGVRSRADGDQQARAATATRNPSRSGGDDDARARSGRQSALADPDQLRDSAVHLRLGQFHDLAG